MYRQVRVNKDPGQISWELAALAKADVQRGIALTGTEIAVLDPPQFADFIKSEIPKWADLAKLAGLHAE